MSVHLGHTLNRAPKGQTVRHRLSGLEGSLNEKSKSSKTLKAQHEGEFAAHLDASPRKVLCAVPHQKMAEAYAYLVYFLCGSVVLFTPNFEQSIRSYLWDLTGSTTCRLRTSSCKIRFMVKYKWMAVHLPQYPAGHPTECVRFHSLLISSGSRTQLLPASTWQRIRQPCTK